MPRSDDDDLNMSEGEEENELPEEEDEEEEEEEEEEEDYGSRKKRKKSSSAISGKFFLDTEAEVENESEEDEYEDEEGDWIDQDAKGRESLKQSDIQEAMERRLYQRRQNALAEKSIEEIARDFEQRHQAYSRDEEDDEDSEQRTHIQQQSYLPSVRDPKLWLVKCKPGKERQTVVSLMQKYFDKMNDPDRLLIKSAICQDHLKGFIYVEADKESHAEAAIKGLRNLQQWGLKLVPIKEMVDVLTVSKKNVSLQRGDWIRIKRGLYKGDIAQVYEYDEARGRMMVKLIPRLSGVGSTPASSETDKEKRKRAIRPAARFFNPDEVRSRDLEPKVDGNGERYYIFEGERYKGGYLLKAMNVKSVITANVRPSLDEVQKFQDKPNTRSNNYGADEDEDRDISQGLSTVGINAPAAPRPPVVFSKGDTVQVIEGDLRLLMGIVDNVEGDTATADYTVTIRPKHEELKDLLSFPASQLAKHFKTGDHVKVVAGKHKGETGLVVGVGKADNSVVIYSNTTRKEIEVLSQDIQECSDVESGGVSLGNYELYDLVTINPQTVGVVVKIDKDSFRVLDNNGTLQTISLQAIGNKRNSRDMVGYDAKQNSLSSGDVIKVMAGQFKDRQATIKHIFRNVAFLHSRDMLENSGIFAERTNNLVLLSALNKRASNAGGYGGGMGGNVPASPYRLPPQSPSHLTFGNRSGPLGMPNMSPRHNSGPGGQPMGGGNAPSQHRRRRDDKILHKTVIITKGQWKGYVGIVKDATETNVRVELHTNCRTITVARDLIVLKDMPANTSSGSSFSSHDNPLLPPRTPMRYDDPSATPSRFAPRTPVWDPQHAPTTPMRGAATPSWDPDWAPRTSSSNSSDSRSHHSSGSSSRDSSGPSPWGHSSGSGSDYPIHTPGSSFGGPFTPFSPAPGSNASVHTPHEQSVYTPGTAFDTPANNTPFTPGSGGGHGHSSHLSHHHDPYGRSGVLPSTPGYMAPTTPVTPGLPQTPHTPGTPGGDHAFMPGDSDRGGMGSSHSTEEDSHWHTPDIEVIVSESYGDRRIAGSTGVIREVLGDECRVQMDENGGVVIVSNNALEPVVPEKKAKHIKIIRGEWKGNTGVLIGIDGADGIVKLTSNLDIKIMDLHHLAVWRQQQ